jgi:DNA repair protein RAD57
MRYRYRRWLYSKRVDNDCFFSAFFSCSHAVSIGNLQTVADLLLNSPQDIAKRCKTSPLEIKRIIDTVLNAIPLHRLNTLEDITHDGNEKFSTGDAILDKALEGGIRTGMIWEVVGERYAIYTKQ